MIDIKRFALLVPVITISDQLIVARQPHQRHYIRETMHSYTLPM